MKTPCTGRLGHLSVMSVENHSQTKPLQTNTMKGIQERVTTPQIIQNINVKTVERLITGKSLSKDI